MADEAGGMSDRPRLASEAAITHALAAMFPEREYAFFPGLRNGTGYARREVRTADAVAMGLWPSRGLLLHGFEIKVSRRDWLAELRDPAKADAIAAYCDRWSLVVGDAAIVEPGELPPKWGLIGPEDRPRRAAPLRVIREAEPLEAKPLDRLLVASILREGRRGPVPGSTVDQAAAERVVAARAERDAMLDRCRAANDKAHAYDQLRVAVDHFERVSGVRITAYDGPRLGEVVRVVLESGMDARALVDRLSAVARGADAIRQEAERHLAALSPPGAP